MSPILDLFGQYNVSYLRLHKHRFAIDIYAYNIGIVPKVPFPKLKRSAMIYAKLQYARRLASEASEVLFVNGKVMQPLVDLPTAVRFEHVE